jgi:hypothetical protein
MKNIFLVFLFCFALNGCATPRYNYRPEVNDVSNPPLEAISTAQVGDTMLQQGKYAEYDAILLKQETRVGTLGSYRFTKGIYIKKGEDDKSEFYLPAGGPNSGQVITGTLTDPFQVMRLDKKTGQICGVTIYNLEVCTKDTDYEKTKYPIAVANSFQQTLIYSGKSGNKIKVGYREFSDDLARPAFSNDVEYDLSESKTIGYKGARIEIIEATNEYVKFKVIKNFNQAKY